MTKDFCDICRKEIQSEQITVRIDMKDLEYECREYCLSCFFDQSNWKKIHTKPGPFKPSPSLVKAKLALKKLRAKYN